MMIARTKRNLAIPAAAPEIPPKPRSPATIAMIAKINAHLSMIDSFHWRNTIADKGFRSLFGLCPAIASVTKFGGLSRARSFGGQKCRNILHSRTDRKSVGVGKGCVRTCRFGGSRDH